MPIFIAHRGNINGRSMNYENCPSYIEKAVDEDYYVEVDIWYSGGWKTGHDCPSYVVSESWVEHLPNAIFHAKNLSAIEHLIEIDVHYFWHQADDYSVTSRNWIWTYPGKVLPRKNGVLMTNSWDDLFNVNMAHAVCSDYVEHLEKLIS